MRDMAFLYNSPIVCHVLALSCAMNQRHRILILASRTYFYNNRRELLQERISMFSQDRFHPILSIRQIGLLPSYIHGHRSETEFLRFSPDGSLLASIAEWDTIVLIWDVKSETLLRKLTFTTKINDLAFSPDGMQIAIATADIITLWDRT